MCQAGKAKGKDPTWWSVTHSGGTSMSINFDKIKDWQQAANSNKQPTIKEIFNKISHNKLLTMYTSAKLKTRGPYCKTSRVTNMEEAKRIHRGQE